MHARARRLSRFTALFLMASVPLWNCGGCRPANPGEEVDASTGGGEGTACTTDDSCSSGLHCQGGVCSASHGSGASSSGGGASSTSGGASSGGVGDAGQGDARVPSGVLQVTPFPAVEFGAQRVGTPVTTNVFARNVGDAALTVVLVYLDNNPTGEFTATPTGNVNRTLQPGDELITQPLNG